MYYTGKRSKMGAQKLEMSLLGKGTVLRFEQDAWATAT